MTICFFFFGKGFGDDEHQADGGPKGSEMEPHEKIETPLSKDEICGVKEARLIPRRRRNMARKL